MLSCGVNYGFWYAIFDPKKQCGQPKTNGTKCDPFFGARIFLRRSVPESLCPLRTCRRIDTDCVVAIFLSDLKRVSLGVQYVYVFIFFFFCTHIPINKRTRKKKILIKAKKAYYYMYNICNNFFRVKKKYISDCCDTLLLLCVVAEFW